MLVDLFGGVINVIFSTRNDQVGDSCEEIVDIKKQVTDEEVSHNWNENFLAAGYWSDPIVQGIGRIR